MQIDNRSRGGPHQEVPRRGAILADRRVAVTGQHREERAEVTGLDRDVEVTMFAGLAAQQRVNSPAAVDPQPRPCTIGQVEEKKHIIKRGLRSGRGAARHGGSMRAYRPRLHTVSDGTPSSGTGQMSECPGGILGTARRLSAPARERGQRYGR